MDRWRLRLTKSVHRGERDLTLLHQKVDQLRVRVRVRVSLTLLHQKVDLLRVRVRVRVS